MNKEGNAGMNMDWLEIWMKQGNIFFESAQKNLTEIFGSGTLGNPKDHWQQVEAWIASLNKQWQFSQLSQQQGIYQDYWKWVAQTCTDATNMMASEWLKRANDNDPIKSVRELYELWLKCCQESYKSSMQSNAFQETFGEMMNATMKFWKNTMPDNR